MLGTFLRSTKSAARPGVRTTITSPVVGNSGRAPVLMARLYGEAKMMRTRTWWATQAEAEAEAREDEREARWAERQETLRRNAERQAAAGRREKVLREAFPR